MPIEIPAAETGDLSSPPQWRRRGDADERAVIDIGSNTVRLVIYGGPLRAPEMLFNEKVTARLGREVKETGLLAEEAVQLALPALRRFAMLLSLRGVRAVTTVATAAVRDATNGQDFLARVAELGLDPVLLSGTAEAFASALGVASAFPQSRGAVADLGGGSLELVQCHPNSADDAVTLPLGSLLLPGLRAGGPAKFTRRVSKLLEASGWRSSTPETLYLVGGSFRAFARYAMNEQRWPLDDPHGYELSPDAAVKLCRKLVAAPVLPVVAGLSAQRQAGLADTAALLSSLIANIAPGRLVFSSWGLREGLLMGTLDEATRKQDPLLTGVNAFAEKSGVSQEFARAVADWIAPVTTVVFPDRHPIRLSAVNLTLAAQSVEPNLRAATGLEWTLRKRWIGVGNQDRAAMAACVLGNAGDTALPDRLLALGHEATLVEGLAWGLALRLARRFSGLAPAVLEGSRLEQDGKALRLVVDGKLAPLLSPATQRDLKALARHLGLSPEIQSVSAN